ncbi:MAG: hypothetical protein GEU98_17785 [Pseudonocardiaceae bacterium]|nr:hypothetical protein [Pseudonocardiaceae bacterium]
MRVPAVVMRGGTSRAVFFHEQDLPGQPASRDQFILQAYGSPDPYARQVDGLGGATSATSKVAVIGSGVEHGVDVTFTFGQVSIERPLIDRTGNCGNISAAVGPFAVDEGLVEATEPVTTVRFLNVNTGKVIAAHVPTNGKRFDPVGDFEIPGVPTPGSRIQLDYLDPGGAVTGKLLPTGQVRDTLRVPGLGAIEVSIVDAANPLVFVDWRSIGLTGLEHPDEIDSDPRLLARLESVRAHAAVLAGISSTAEHASALVPSVPKLAIVGQAREYHTTDGARLRANESTLRASMMSMGRVHRAFALTGAICTSVAAGIPGTVVAEAAAGAGQQRDADGRVVIGHPSGVIAMRAEPYPSGGAWTVDVVSAYRTARRLMEGWALVPDERMTPVAR